MNRPDDPTSTDGLGGGAGGTTILLQELLRQMSTLTASLSDVRRDVTEMKLDVQGLTKIIRDGNGKPSLITQAALTDRMLAEMSTSVKEIQRTQEVRAVEDQKGRWSIALAIVSGLLAFLTSVTVAVITLMMRKGP